MKTLFGIELYPRRKTDEEYVEAIRKQIPMARKVALFQFFGGVVILVASWRLLVRTYEQCKDAIPAPTGVQEMEALLAILMGLMAGVAIGILSFQGLAFIGAALNLWFGSRRERLLVEYFDRSRPSSK